MLSRQISQTETGRPISLVAITASLILWAVRDIWEDLPHTESCIQADPPPSPLLRRSGLRGRSERRPCRRAHSAVSQSARLPPAVNTGECARRRPAERQLLQSSGHRPPGQSRRFCRDAGHRPDRPQNGAHEGEFGQERLIFGASNSYAYYNILFELNCQWYKNVSLMR